MELDVIVFEGGDRRFAIELSYVQEVFSLGYVTPVPLAPPPIRGATNLRGRMLPVISIHPLFGLPDPTTVLLGATALLVHSGQTSAAIPVERVIDVLSVDKGRYEEGGQGTGPLVPGSFRGAAGSTPLLDMDAVLRSVERACGRANESIRQRSEVH